MKVNFFNKFLALSIILITFTAVELYSQTYQGILGQKEINTITTSVPFLMIAPDSRAGSMGDCGVSSTPDANSQHWNPAKYPFTTSDIGFSVSYSPWLRALVNDISLAYLTGYKKLNKDQAISASLLFFSIGQIDFTDKQGYPIGSFTPTEYAFDLAYSRKFSKNVAGSVAMRYIYSNLTGGIFVGSTKSNAGQSVATDVAVYYQKPLKFNQQKALLSVGTNISNIGTKISYSETVQRDFIPTNLRIGPSFYIELDKYNTILGTIEFNKLLVPTPPKWKRDLAGQPVYDPSGNMVIEAGKDPNVSVVTGMLQSFSDAPGGFNEELKEFTWALGVEYWYDKQFALRAGYFHESPQKGNRQFFTLGAGLKYNVFGLNFAYLIPTEQRNPLENTLRFSLLFDFDAFTQQNKDNPSK